MSLNDDNLNNFIISPTIQSTSQFPSPHHQSISHSHSPLSSARQWLNSQHGALSGKWIITLVLTMLLIIVIIGLSAHIDKTAAHSPHEGVIGKPMSFMARLKKLSK